MWNRAQKTTSVVDISFIWFVSLTYASLGGSGYLRYVKQHDIAYLQENVPIQYVVD